MDCCRANTLLATARLPDRILLHLSSNIVPASARGSWSDMPMLLCLSGSPFPMLETSGALGMKRHPIHQLSHDKECLVPSLSPQVHDAAGQQLTRACVAARRQSGRPWTTNQAGTAIYVGDNDGDMAGLRPRSATRRSSSPSMWSTGSSTPCMCALVQHQGGVSLAWAAPVASAGM